MKSPGWLTGCALALACAHESKGVVSQSDTKMQGAVVGASQPPADGATAAISPFNVNVQGADCGCRAVRRRLARPHYSALHLRDRKSTRLNSSHVDISDADL